MCVFITKFLLQFAFALFVQTFHQSNLNSVQTSRRYLYKPYSVSDPTFVQTLHLSGPTFIQTLHLSDPTFVQTLQLSGSNFVQTLRQSDLKMGWSLSVNFPGCSMCSCVCPCSPPWSWLCACAVEPLATGAVLPAAAYVKHVSGCTMCFFDTKRMPDVSSRST